MTDDRPPDPAVEPGSIPDRLAHDLKTPLSTIHGYAMTLLDQEDLSDDSRRWLLEVIVRECERMTRMIEDFRGGAPA
jgi:signal transduction histidine kinase